MNAPHTHYDVNVPHVMLIGFADGDPFLFKRSEFYEDYLPSLLWPVECPYDLDEGGTMRPGPLSGLNLTEVYHYRQLQVILTTLTTRDPAKFALQYFRPCPNTNLYEALAIIDD